MQFFLNLFLPQNIILTPRPNIKVSIIKNNTTCTCNVTFIQVCLVHQYKDMHNTTFTLVMSLFYKCVYGSTRMYGKTCTCYVTFLQVCVRQYKEVRQDLHLLQPHHKWKGNSLRNGRHFVLKKNNILTIEYLFMFN